MRPVFVLFWLVWLVSLLWLGWQSIHLGILASYHPMSTQSDWLYPVKQWAFFIPLAVAVTMLSMRLWTKRVLAPRVYPIALFWVLIALSLSFLPRMDNDYHQTYWLQHDRYDIPWAYSPYNGDPNKGGLFFLIKLSATDLTPRYQTDGPIMTVGKAVDYNFGKGGVEPNSLCQRNTHYFECEWPENGFVYRASGDARFYDQVTAQKRQAIVALLDSFQKP